MKTTWSVKKDYCTSNSTSVNVANTFIMLWSTLVFLPESLLGHDTRAELGDGDILGRYPEDVEHATGVLKQDRRGDVNNKNMNLSDFKVIFFRRS